jgi:chromosome segregation ATPase
LSGFVAGLGRLWELARAIEDLRKNEKDSRDGLNAINDRLRALEDRMTALEANERHMITEARNAATAAASVMIAGMLSETVTRITRLEERAAAPRSPPINADHQISGPGGPPP